jgi:hypothetical protein
VRALIGGMISRRPDACARSIVSTFTRPFPCSAKHAMALGTL